MNKLIIKKHHPLHSLLLVISISLTISVVVWFLMNMQHWSCIRGQLKTALTSQSLWGVNQRLESENKLLGEKLIRLERGHQIEKMAAIGLQSEVQKLQDKLYKLKRELEFYHGVMESVQGVKGLNIQGLLIEPLEQAGHYHFKLILTYTAKKGAAVAGQLEVVVKGTEEGQAAVLRTPGLFAGSTPDLDLHFKNFKQVNERLILPADFKPDKVIVRIRRQGKKSVAIEKIFDWPNITKSQERIP